MGRLENLARERIVKWRKQHKVSQERLGTVVQPPLHQTTVGKWEKGDLSVDVDTLDAWARFFGRTLFDLIAHDELTSGPPEIVALFNALPTEDLKQRVRELLEAVGGTASGTLKPPGRGSKRG